VQSTVRELLLMSVFCSRNIGFLSRVCGQVVRLPDTYVPTLKRSVYVFFCNDRSSCNGCSFISGKSRVGD